MNEEKKYHLIDQYLNGELTGRSLDNFKAMLKDPEFAKQVEVQRQIMEVIKEERKTELKRLLSESSKVQYFQNSWGNTWTYASAAIVVLFVSAFFILKKYNGPETLTPTVTVESSDEEVQAEMDTTEVDSNMVAMEETRPDLADNASPETESIEEELTQEETESISDEEMDVFSEELDSDVNIETERALAENVDAIPEIKKDQIISGKKFTVVRMTPDFGPTRAKASEVDDTSASELQYKEVNRRSLNVEFWKSPVGFKGYKYSSDKLILYDIDESTAIAFKELDNRLYLSLDGNYYHLEKNSTYNKFVAVTNKTLLKVLND